MAGGDRDETPKLWHAVLCLNLPDQQEATMVCLFQEDGNRKRVAARLGITIYAVHANVRRVYSRLKVDSIVGFCNEAFDAWVKQRGGRRGEPRGGRGRDVPRIVRHQWHVDG